MRGCGLDALAEVLNLLAPLTAAGVALTFFPYWEGGGISPRWMVLAILTAAGLCAAPRITMTRLHWLGAAFLGYATLSLGWTPQLDLSLGHWFTLVILAGVFMVAAELEDSRPTELALAAGVAVSGAVALGQVTHVWEVAELVGPAGLFVNKNYLSEIAVGVLVLVALRGWWWMIPGPALALVLSHSRGALVALAAVVLAWVLPRSKLAAGVLVALYVVGGAAMVSGGTVINAATGQEEHLDTSSFVHRIGVWGPTLRYLSLFGYGYGSFYSVYPTFHPHVVLAVTRPEHAHNELIDVASDLGICGAALWLAFFGWALWAADETERLVLVALLAISSFSFPFQLPATGYLAAFVAGRIARRSRRLRRTVGPGGAERVARLSLA